MRWPAVVVYSVTRHVCIFPRNNRDKKIYIKISTAGPTKAVDGGWREGSGGGGRGSCSAHAFQTRRLRVLCKRSADTDFPSRKALLPSPEAERKADRNREPIKRRWLLRCTQQIPSSSDWLLTSLRVAVHLKLGAPLIRYIPWQKSGRASHSILQISTFYISPQFNKVIYTFCFHHMCLNWSRMPLLWASRSISVNEFHLCVQGNFPCC